MVHSAICGKTHKLGGENVTVPCHEYDEFRFINTAHFQSKELPKDQSRRNRTGIVYDLRHRKKCEDWPGEACINQVLNRTVFTSYSFPMGNPFKATRIPDLLVLDSLPNIFFTFIFLKRDFDRCVSSAATRFGGGRQSVEGRQVYVKLSQHLEELQANKSLSRSFELHYEWGCSDPGRFKQVLCDALDAPDLDLPADNQLCRKHKCQSARCG